MARAVPGYQALATVRKVTQQTAHLSLPHRVSGTVTCSNVNPVAAALAKGAAVDSGSEEEDVGTPGLRRVLYVGQVVPCVVLEQRARSAAAAAAARIQGVGAAKAGGAVVVSLDPSVVNHGLGMEHLGASGLAVWGYVASREDHGFTVNLGVAGVNAFLPFKNVAAGGPKLRLGSAAFFTVAAAVPAASSVTLSWAASPPVKNATKDKRHGIGSLKPGMLVKASVLSASGAGLQVSVLGMQASAPVGHLPKPCTAFWQAAYPARKSLKCRVLSVNTTAKLITVSAAPHVMALHGPKFAVSVGDIVEDALIVRVDAKSGLTVAVPSADPDAGDDTDASVSGIDSDSTEADDAAGGAGGDAALAKRLSAAAKWGTLGFAPVSKLPKGKRDHIERVFKVGATARCRVVGLYETDGVASVSLEQSVVDADAVTYDGLKPGQSVSGEVVKVGTFGALVSLGSGVTGLLTPMHFTDLVMKSRKISLAAGTRVRCRVLTVDPAKRKLMLTRKRTLLSSKLPAIASYAEAIDGAPNLVSHGFVTAVKPKKGVIVTFYGNVYGMVSAADMQKSGLGTPASAGHMVGQPVKVRVAGGDAERRRLALSFNTNACEAGKKPAAGAGDDPMGASDSSDSEAEDVEPEVTSTQATDPGVVCSGLVTAAAAALSGKPGQEAFLVQLKDDAGAVMGTARLPTQHLADDPEESTAKASALTVGTALPHLVVMNTIRGTPVVSAKPLLVTAAREKAHTLVSKLEDLRVGALVPGVITSITTFGAFVRFLGGRLTALVPNKFVKDAYVADASEHVKTGAAVWTVVKSVDNDKLRALVSLRQSDVAPLLGGKAAKAKKDKAAKKGREEAPAAPAAKVPTVAATSLSAGDVVRCRIDTPSVRVDDRLGVDPSAAAGKASLVVELVGVKGRYHARLSLAECCDVCPVTGAVADDGGFAAFKRLATQPVDRRSPHLFEAKIVTMRTKAGRKPKPSTKKKKAKKEKDTTIVNVELTIRRTDMELPAGKLAYTRAGLEPPTPDAAVAWSSKPLARAVNAGHVCAAGVTPGAWTFGVVESVLPDGVMVGIGAGVRGKVFVLDVATGGDDNDVDARLVALNQVANGAKLTPGTPVQCVVTRASSRPQLSMAAAPAVVAAAAAAGGAGRAGKPFKAAKVAAAVAAGVALCKPPAVVPGAAVFARVCAPAQKKRPSGGDASDVERKGSRCGGGSLRLQVASRAFGMVPATHSGDPAEWVDAPFKRFVVGQIVRAVVLPALPPAAAPPAAADRKPAKRVRVASDSDSEGDDDVDLSASESEGGGKKKASKAKPARRRRQAMVLSLRPSLLRRADAGPIDVEDLLAEDASEADAARQKGAIVPGFVTLSAQSRGCVVQLCRGVAGYVTVRQLADGFVGNVAASFPPGKLVAGRVLRVGDRVELTLKSSAVTGKRAGAPAALGKRGRSESSSSEAEDEDEDATDDSDVEGGQPVAASDSDSSSSDDGDDGALDATTRRLSFSVAGAGADSDSDSDSDRPSGFDWGDDAGLAPVRAFAPPVAASDSDSDASEGTSDGEDAGGAPGRRARKSAAKKLDQEADRREAKLMSEDFEPETAEDFERLLVASPNSSLLWIQYMAFQVMLTEVDAARAVAERAVKAVAHNDEQDKLNVWVAYLNLENAYGDEPSLGALFARALQHNDPKKVHLHMLSMFEAHDKAEEANALYKIATRKFSTSRKFWSNWVAFLFACGEGARARTVQARAVATLPKRKHVVIMSKFAVLEYRKGSREQGRTAFESLLSAFPKRLDLWNVYIDQEVSAAEHAAAQRLFDRAIQLKMSSKKAKSFFKKYLQFEEAHGNAKTLKHVQEAITAHVQRMG